MHDAFLPLGAVPRKKKGETNALFSPLSPDSSPVFVLSVCLPYGNTPPGAEALLGRCILLSGGERLVREPPGFTNGFSWCESSIRRYCVHQHIPL